ncbi:unnamed protein product, partial [Symbiodinium natans]
HGARVDHFPWPPAPRGSPARLPRGSGDQLCAKNGVGNYLRLQPRRLPWNMHAGMVHADRDELARTRGRQGPQGACGLLPSEPRS